MRRNYRATIFFLIFVKRGAIKINIRRKKNQIFHHKGGPFGGFKISYFGFASSYRGNDTISEILRVNALQKLPKLNQQMTCLPLYTNDSNVLKNSLVIVEN